MLGTVVTAVMGRYWTCSECLSSAWAYRIFIKNYYRACSTGVTGVVELSLCMSSVTPVCICVLVDSKCVLLYRLQFLLVTPGETLVGDT